MNSTPGEESEAPGEAQKHGESGNTAHLLPAAANLHVVRVLLLNAAQLDHHHDKHGEVQQEDETEVRHHSNVEGNVIFYPATVGKNTFYNNSVTENCKVSFTSLEEGRLI